MIRSRCPNPICRDKIDYIISGLNRKVRKEIDNDPKRSNLIEKVIKFDFFDLLIDFEVIFFDLFIKKWSNLIEKRSKLDDFNQKSIKFVIDDTILIDDSGTLIAEA